MTKNNRNLREIANQIMEWVPQVKLRAFTLAEVLITLVIIGVVSVLVLPTVINKVQGYANKRAHMVFQSKIKTGIQLMTGSNALAGYQTTEQFVEQLRRYIKIAKVCDNEHLTECFSASITGVTNAVIETKNGLKLRDLYGVNLDGAENTNVNGIILQDGTNILIAYNTNCKQPENASINANMGCFSIVYDTNGGAKPNKLGVAETDFDVSLGEQENNSNLNNVKDIGKINAQQYGEALKFNGTAESCVAIGGAVDGAKCRYDRDTSNKSYNYAVEKCAALNMTYPTRAEMATYLGFYDGGDGVVVNTPRVNEVYASNPNKYPYGGRSFIWFTTATIKNGMICRLYIFNDHKLYAVDRDCTSSQTAVTPDMGFICLGDITD